MGLRCSGDGVDASRSVLGASLAIAPFLAGAPPASEIAPVRAPGGTAALASPRTLPASREPGGPRVFPPDPYALSMSMSTRFASRKSAPGRRIFPALFLASLLAGGAGWSPPPLEAQDAAAQREAAAAREAATARQRGADQAAAMARGLEEQFQLDMARIKEGQARGFISAEEARKAGREAAVAYNEGIIQAIDRSGGAVGMGRERFVELAGSMKNVTQESWRAGVGMGALRQTTASLAAQAAGAHPVVGRLASVVGGLALGSAMTIGVLGGLAAIGLAYRKITEDAREMRRAVDEGIAALKQLSEQRRQTEEGRIRDMQRSAVIRMGEIEREAPSMPAIHAMTAMTWTALIHG